MNRRFRIETETDRWSRLFWEELANEFKAKVESFSARADEWKSQNSIAPISSAHDSRMANEALFCGPV